MKNVILLIGRELAAQKNIRQADLIRALQLYLVQFSVSSRGTWSNIGGGGNLLF